MTDKENGNPPRPDAPDPPPPDPGPANPPQIDDTPPMDGVEHESDSAATQAGAANHNLNLEENDGFTTVITNGEKRRQPKSVADANTITGPSTPAPPNRTSNVPPPPRAIYENDQTTILQDEKGLSITYSKVKYTQRFKKGTRQAVFPGKDFQSLIGMLQKEDPSLMICPLAPTAEGNCNYIDQTCYIPVTEGSQLQNYFTHTVLKDTIHGVFIIRTKKTIISLKENGYVQS